MPGRVHLKFGNLPLSLFGEQRLALPPAVPWKDSRGKTSCLQFYTSPKQTIMRNIDSRTTRDMREKRRDRKHKANVVSILRI